MEISKVGQNVLNLRKMRGMAGISPYTVWDIEKGNTQKPTRRIMECLSFALGVTPEELGDGVPQAQVVTVHKSQEEEVCIPPADAQQEHIALLEKLIVQLICHKERR